MYAARAVHFGRRAIARRPLRFSWENDSFHCFLSRAGEHTLTHANMPCLAYALPCLALGLALHARTAVGFEFEMMIIMTCFRQPPARSGEVFWRQNAMVRFVQHDARPARTTPPRRPR